MTVGELAGKLNKLLQQDPEKYYDQPICIVTAAGSTYRLTVEDPYNLNVVFIVTDRWMEI